MVRTSSNKFIRAIKSWLGYNLYENNRIICVDFDGVINSYKSGWKGIDNIPDPPVVGAIEFLIAHLPVPDSHGMSSHYTGPIVQIYSSRSRSWRGRRAMKQWLIYHGLPSEYITDGLLKFPTKKPPAFLQIDDRAVTFNGTFPSTEEMMDFKPWYYTKKKPAQGKASPRFGEKLLEFNDHENQPHAVVSDGKGSVLAWPLNAVGEYKNHSVLYQELRALSEINK